MGCERIWSVSLWAEEISMQEETSGMCTQRRGEWGHREAMAICKSKREASGESKPIDTLILDFSSPHLWGKKFLLFKVLNPWYRAMAAHAVLYWQDKSAVFFLFLTLSSLNILKLLQLVPLSFRELLVFSQVLWAQYHFYEYYILAYHVKNSILFL